MRPRGRKLDIAGTVYRVEFCSEEECEELEGRYGYTDLDLKVIVIRSTDPLEVQQDTLLHETLHAFFEQIGMKAFLDLTLPPKTDRVAWEESFISAIAPRVMQLVKSNKRKLWLL